jgi:hypothetical protein
MVNQPEGNQAELPQPAWSYRVVFTAIVSVTTAFIVVVAMFAFLRVWTAENAANITAALSALFGIVGTLVGAYFGIKASSDAQDSSAITARQAVGDQKDTVKDALHKTTTTVASTTSQGASGTNPVDPKAIALATFILVAGGASLLGLRYYLGRMQNAA